MDLFTSEEYQKIDIANKYGLDKLNWIDRIKWFNSNENNLANVVDEAEEPASFYASLKAYNLGKAGGSVGYPISLDATSSGVQMLAALTRDKKAASLSNIVDVGYRENLYSAIHNKIGNIVEYEKVKKAIMTSVYGSEERPKEAFGNKYDLFCSVMNKEMPRVWMLTSIMLDLWDEQAYSYKWIMPDGFNVIQEVMASKWTTFSFKGTHYNYHHYVNEPIKRGERGSRSLLANVAHSLDGFVNRELTRRAMHDPEQIKEVLNTLAERPRDANPSGRQADNLKRLWGFYKAYNILSARVLDYINPYTSAIIDEPKAIYKLINTFPKKPFEVISIHDMFRVHPNYGNDVRKLYNHILADINESDFFNYVMSSLIGKPISFNLGSPFGNEIRVSNYSLS